MNVVRVLIVSKFRVESESWIKNEFGIESEFWAGSQFRVEY